MIWCLYEYYVIIHANNISAIAAVVEITDRKQKTGKVSDNLLKIGYNLGYAT